MINRKKSFVLIELLVVVAVIGILASIIFVSVNGARERARDAKRKLDLANINMAIKLYYQAKGYYPNPGGDWCLSSDYPSKGFGASDCWKTLEGDLKSEGLVSSLPIDPKNNCRGDGGEPQIYGPFANNCYAYVYIHRDYPFSDGSYSYAIDHEPQYYDLFTRLENKKDPQRCQLKCYKVATFNEPGSNFCRGSASLPCPNCTHYCSLSYPNELYSARQ